jgi:thiol:disulfide interchange protein
MNVDVLGWTSADSRLPLLKTKHSELLMRHLALLLVLTSLGSLRADDLDFKLPGSKPKARTFADVADLSLSLEPTSAKLGDKVTLTLTITPKKGCYTYPFNPTKPQLSVNALSLAPNSALELTTPIIDPPGAKEKPGALPNTIDQYYTQATTWKIPLTVGPKATPGKTTISFAGSRLQACNEDNCIPLNKLPTLEFEVLPGGVATSMPVVEPKNPVVETKNPVADARGSESAKQTKAPLSTTDYKGQLESISAALEASPIVVQGGFTGLILAAIFWGFVSLVTPCVFPMIPITVSLFLKQSNLTSSSVLKLAIIYCLTIIVMLGSSAIFLLSAFRELSVNPYMNIFLAVLFIAFALSLFGLYDITLPNFLLRGAEAKRKTGGIIGTVFGAVAFSIVSFTCVAPFLGGFAGLAASGNYSTWQLALAGLAFSTAFASPFFFLAMFPSLIKKLPKSGGWLDTVKAVMGFLELAAAFKFLRTAELRLLDQPQYFTYDVALAAWVVISLAAGGYLLNFFRLPHDEEKPHVGVVRMLFGLMLLGFGLHLAPALFPPTRPTGTVYAWVNSFLLPDPAERAKGLAWGTDLKAEIDRIVTEKKVGRTPEKPYIFIDFTGVTCTNCTLNEENVFPQRRVTELLKKFSLVKLYTDEVPAQYYNPKPDISQRTAEGRANTEFQSTRFGTEQLPLYVILDPQADGQVKVVGVYDEGKINNVERFVEFLAKPWAK